MNIESIISHRISQSIEVKNKLLRSSALLADIRNIAESVCAAINGRHTIFFAGNGGSYADSIHLAAELTVRFRNDRRPIPAIALGSNNSILTATGNDYSFEDIFARELQALGKKDDILLAISTSGNSANILKAANTAIQLGMTVFGFTGEDGGKLKNICTCLNVPSDDTARIQEAHILIGHIICEIAEFNFIKVSG